MAAAGAESRVEESEPSAMAHRTDKPQGNKMEVQKPQCANRIGKTYSICKDRTEWVLEQNISHVNVVQYKKIIRFAKFVCKQPRP